jgi:hypothetical protein
VTGQRSTSTPRVNTAPPTRSTPRSSGTTRSYSPPSRSSNPTPSYSPPSRSSSPPPARSSGQSSGSTRSSGSRRR